MPNRDGTGPRGKGSQTGSKMGKCAGSENISWEERNETAGCGKHRGVGNGWKKHKDDNKNTSK